MHITQNVLCIVPPYNSGYAPPACAAALLAYMKSQGCHDFDFLDLRLYVPNCYAPTYSPIGAFGESYVMDIPDLPLVLTLLRAWEGRFFPLFGTSGAADDRFERYCLERGISPDYLSNYLRSMDRYLGDVFNRIADLRFVGLSIWTSNFLTSLLAAAYLKNRRNPPFILAGGPQVTESAASAELGLRAGLFDAVALGEGERTLFSVYDAYRNGDRDTAIPGVLRRGSPTPQGRARLLRLNELPTPDFSQMALPLYSRAPGKHVALPYQLSRGCTDECSFCSEWVFWQHFRPGSSIGAVGQIEELVGRYSADTFHFTDSLLNGHMGRLRQFAEELIKRNVKIAWAGFMRAQMDADTAALLARAGFRYAFVGIESLSDSTLEVMNKRRTEADNMAALRGFLEAGIAVRAGVIPGFPADDRHRFLHTLSGLAAISKEYPGRLELNVEPFIVSPGQPLYQNLTEMGLTGIPWSDETIDIAPGYADITSKIFREVTGANQGIERMGQLLLAEVHRSRSHRVDPFVSFRSNEWISPLSIHTEPIDGNWSLLIVKSAAARPVAIICSVEERRRLEAMRPRIPGTTPLLDDPEFRQLWETVECEHVLAASREWRGWHRILSLGPSVAMSALFVPDHVIARHTAPIERHPELMLTNILNCATARLPTILSPVVLRLSQEALHVEDLSKLVADSGYSPADWLDLQRDLISVGLLHATDVPPKLTRQIESPSPPAGRRLHVLD